MKSALFIALSLFFQIQTPKAQNAQQLKDFSLISANGIKKTLSDFDSFSALVIITDNQECAYSEYYEDRFEALQEKFEDQNIAFIKVTPSGVHPAGQNVFEDQRQELLPQLGAKKITEVFLVSLFKKSGTVVYSGAFDDNPQLPSSVKETYLEDAVEQLLTEKKVNRSRTRPTGCTIRK